MRCHVCGIFLFFFFFWYFPQKHRICFNHLLFYSLPFFITSTGGKKKLYKEKRKENPPVTTTKYYDGDICFKKENIPPLSWCIAMGMCVWNKEKFVFFFLATSLDEQNLYIYRKDTRGCVCR